MGEVYWFEAIGRRLSTHCGHALAAELRDRLRQSTTRSGSLKTLFTSLKVKELRSAWAGPRSRYYSSFNSVAQSHDMIVTKRTIFIGARSIDSRKHAVIAYF